MDRASKVLCCDSPTALTRAYCLGATHCCRMSGRAGVEITWHSTKKNRAKSKTRKLCARPWRKRNGIPRARDIRISCTGRKRENQRPKGSDSRAEVSHQTPWSSPASSRERCKSSLTKGRNTPKVYETRMILLPWKRDSNTTAQPRAGVRVSPAEREAEVSMRIAISFLRNLNVNKFTDSAL